MLGGSIAEHFQASCKDGTGDKHLSNILRKSPLHTKRKNKAEEKLVGGPMRDKG